MKPGAYIAIEGPIGVGKTTLAGRLADSLGSGVLAEAPEENPFLADFYADPGAYALPAQLSFLLQRARQIDGLRQADLFDNGCVADFMFDKDPLFARLNLSGPELKLYEDISARLAWRPPRPDCVIYIHASVDTLMARIEKRARRAERGLQREYLVRVVDAYHQFFSTYDATPLIRVDAEKMDLVGNPTDYRTLVTTLGRRLTD